MRELLRRLPVRSIAVGGLFLGGVAAISTALWWLHPAAGLAFAGIAALALSFAAARNG